MARPWMALCELSEVDFGCTKHFSSPRPCIGGAILVPSEVLPVLAVHDAGCNAVRLTKKSRPRQVPALTKTHFTVTEALVMLSSSTKVSFVVLLSISG